jgi:hypothetical protein
MRYCEPSYQGSLVEGIQTYFYCDWNGVLYASASECYTQCSQLLVSRSDVQFVILLVFSLFVLLVLSLLFKVIVD